MADKQFLLHIWRDGRMIVETEEYVSPNRAEDLQLILEDIQHDFMDKRIVILQEGWAVQYHDGPAPIFDTSNR